MVSLSVFILFLWSKCNEGEINMTKAWLQVIIIFNFTICFTTRLINEINAYLNIFLIITLHKNIDYNYQLHLDLIKWMCFYLNLEKLEEKNSCLSFVWWVRCKPAKVKCVTTSFTVNWLSSCCQRSFFGQFKEFAITESPSSPDKILICPLNQQKLRGAVRSPFSPTQFVCHTEWLAPDSMVTE